MQGITTIYTQCLQKSHQLYQIQNHHVTYLYIRKARMIKSLTLTLISCICLCGCLNDNDNIETTEIPISEGSDPIETPITVPTPTPVQAPTTPIGTNVEILFEDFESGWGEFLDGGLFSKIYSDDTIIEGNCASVFSNDGVISSFLQRTPMNLIDVESFNLTFWVHGDGLVDGDALLVEFSDDVEWRTLARLVKGEDFENDSFTEISIDVSSQDYIFSQAARIQFVGATEGNPVFIDDISISINGTLGENIESSQGGEYIFEHSDLEIGCSGCHGNNIAVGKFPSHIESLDDCQICHIAHDPNGWEAFPYPEGTYNHTDVTTGCFDCHNAVLAATKPETHIDSNNSCEQCHTTQIGGWDLLQEGVTYLHEAVTIGTTVCVSCHDGGVAEGKNATHIPTGDNCEECHTPNQPWSNLTFLDEGTL